MYNVGVPSPGPENPQWCTGGPAAGLTKLCAAEEHGEPDSERPGFCQQAA